jgi:outer membrane protein assembly factor BamB
LNLKRNRKLFTKVGILSAVILVGVILLTGCVQGMQPIGWSGIAINDNGVAYTGSKEGRLVAVNLNNNTVTARAEPLKAASSGGAGCTSSGGGFGSACGGTTPAVAIYGTPVTANTSGFGNLVYIAGYNGKVFAYDASSLQQRWVFPVDGNIKPIVSSIFVDNGTLYFGCTDFNLYALDTTTGALKWQFATEGEIWSSPIVDNNIVFIASFDKNIYAVDVATGKEKWKFATGANNVSTPLAVNGILYVGSLDRNLYALNEADGSFIWKFTGGNWFWARPLFTKGVIYAPCLDSKIYSLDAKSGNRIATYDAGGQVASWPVMVDNQVIAATVNGKLLGLDTTNTASSPRQIATIPVNVTAPLSAFNNKIYINGPDNNIYAYDLVSGNKVSTISLASK